MADEAGFDTAVDTPTPNAAGGAEAALRSELQALREQYRSCRAALDALSRSQGIIEFSLDGTVTRVNENFARLTGYSAEELVGQHHSKLCARDYAESKAYREFWQTLAAGRYHEGLFPRVNKQGNTFWIRASYNPVFDQDGKVSGYIKIAVDGTEDHARAVTMRRFSAGLESASINIMLNDEKRNIVYANPAVMKMFRDRAEELRARFPGFDPENLIGQSMDHFHRDPAHQKALLSDPARMPHSGEIEVAGVEFRVNASYIADGDGNYMGNIVEWQDITQARKAEREIRDLVAAASRGEFDNRLDTSRYDGFFQIIADLLNELVDVTGRGLTDIANVMNLVAAGDLSGRIEAEYLGLFGQLKDDVNNTVDSLNAGFSDVMRVLGALADGDLTGSITADHPGLFAKLKSDVNTTMDNLREMVTQIRQASQSINTSATEISRGNLDLSQRTEEQASSLEETASSMEQMTSAVKSSATNAAEARTLAEGASKQAAEGGEVVGQAVTAMAGITDASNQISDIITVIDEIAFQTNLLALNAAVEAARAGEQGRGFAVVAAEVRNLAQRSAEAAKQIKGLIKNSVARVEDGSRLVNSSGDTLKAIVESVQKVAAIVADIASSASEQADGIEQVNNAVTQLDEVTQQNAALVEQAAAASKSLDDQTHGLEELVSRFRVADGGKPAPAARPGGAATPARKTTAPPAASPAPSSAPARKSAPGGGAGSTAGNAIRSPVSHKSGADDDDDWEEF